MKTPLTIEHLLSDDLPQARLSDSTGQPIAIVLGDTLAEAVERAIDIAAAVNMDAVLFGSEKKPATFVDEITAQVDEFLVGTARTKALLLAAASKEMPRG